MCIKGCYNQRERNFYFITIIPITLEYLSLPVVNSKKLATQQMTKDFCRIKALKSPTVEHILENINGYDIAHFACHGLVDSKDSLNSHLLLQRSGASGPVVDELTVS